MKMNDASFNSLLIVFFKSEFLQLWCKVPLISAEGRRQRQEGHLAFWSVLQWQVTFVAFVISLF